MSQADHIVPAMPELALLADNGGIVTVNPDWCDWYEQVFNQAAGAGYIKGREIMHQVDGAYSELFRIRSEAVKSAIHSMISNDPNRPTVHFNSIAEARKSFELAGKHAMDFDKEEQVFTFDGYFSVKDMEAILFIRRAEDLIDKAKEKFGGFFSPSGVDSEQLDVNKLMQVMQPSLERTDVDSHIFAKPDSMFADLPAGAHDGYQDRAVGITEQRMYAGKTAQLQEALDNLQDKSTSIASEFDEQIIGLADLLPSNTSSAGALLPTSNAVLNRMITEGGGLRRGESMAISVETDRSKTQLSRGLPMHAFEKGDPDQEMLETLLDRVNNFGKHFSGTPLFVESIQGQFSALKDFGSMFFTKGDHGAIYLCRYNGLVKENLISFKAMEYSNPEGQIVVIEHAPETVSYDEIKDFIETFVSLTPERVKATDNAAKIMRENMVPLHVRQLLDITGEPVPKYLTTSLPGGNSISKDLSVLINMSQEEFNDLGTRITELLGEGTSPEENEVLKGITHRDYLRVAMMRLKGEI